MEKKNMNGEVIKVSNEVAPSPQGLLMKAVEQGLPVEQLEKLMELQERWEKKEAAKAFKSAMSEFQAIKPQLIKGAKVDYDLKGGGKVKYNFIPLPSIQKAIDGLLSKCGLSYRWEQDDAGGVIKITCVVSHLDGHEERTYLSAPADTSGNKNNIQSIGSTVSYLKRYTLEGACGLSSANDDDGNSQVVPKKGKPFISADRYKDAIKAINSDRATKALILETYQLTDEQDKAIDLIVENKLKQRLADLNKAKDDAKKEVSNG